MGITPFDAACLLFQDTSLGPEDTTQPASAAEGKIQGAMSFLCSALEQGARPAREVEAEAQAQGIAHSTLAEARKRLHIASKRASSGWLWIPPAEASLRKC
jgi:hypothetical protein